jgi:hypothetical protein
MRKRRNSDAGDDSADGWFAKPHMASQHRDAESGSLHAQVQDAVPFTPGMVLKTLVWIGLLALAVTLVFNTLKIVGAKTHEVVRMREVAHMELNQTCCRSLYGTGPPVTVSEARSCTHILGEDKRLRGINRCESAHEVLQGYFLLQVAAATWGQIVPMGGMSLMEWIVSSSFQVISSGLVMSTLRRLAIG